MKKILNLCIIIAATLTCFTLTSCKEEVSDMLFDIEFGGGSMNNNVISNYVFDYMVKNGYSSTSSYFLKRGNPKDIRSDASSKFQTACKEYDDNNTLLDNKGTVVKLVSITDDNEVISTYTMTH